MKEEAYQFSYKIYNSIRELNPEDASLLEKAQQVTEQAYAPYSRFRVGAVAKLTNGEYIMVPIRKMLLSQPAYARKEYCFLRRLLYIREFLLKALLSVIEVSKVIAIILFLPAAFVVSLYRNMN